MSTSESEMGVWHCQETEWDCETWAAPLGDPPKDCPSCTGPVGRALKMISGAPIVYLGTLEEMRQKEAAQGIAPHDSPIRIPKPPPLELVPLQTLPREKWSGLPVFHPSGQCGIGADAVCSWYRYDVGLIVEVYPDPHFEGELQVRFVNDDSGYGLSYAPCWLWVPKVLALNLLGAPGANTYTLVTPPAEECW